MNNNLDNIGEIDIFFNDIDDKNEMVLMDLIDNSDDDDDDDDDSQHDYDNHYDNFNHNNDNDNNYDSDLDISWINLYEKELNIDQNVMREPINEITIKTVFISKNNNGLEIVKYTDDIVKTCMINTSHGLTKEFLLYYIQSRKLMDGIKYKLDSILTYVVSIEPENIQTYINNTQFTEFSSSFIRKINIIEDILFSDSIFVFHPINCVYLFMIENNSINSNTIFNDDNLNSNVKSILKNKTRKCDTDSNNKSKYNITKKVYFFDESPDKSLINKKKNITRKNIYFINKNKNSSRKLR